MMIFDLIFFALPFYVYFITLIFVRHCTVSLIFILHDVFLFIFYDYFAECCTVTLVRFMHAFVVSIFFVYLFMIYTFVVDFLYTTFVSGRSQVTRFFFSLL